MALGREYAAGTGRVALGREYAAGTGGMAPGSKVLALGDSG